MNVVVIGASAAGLKAACRVKRLRPEANVTVIEKGKHISYSACGLPYFLSGDVDSFRELNTTAYDVVKDVDYFRDTKGVEVMTGTMAVSINPDKRYIEVVQEGGEVITMNYDKLVIATGANPAIPDIPGVDLQRVCTFTKAEDAIELRKALQTGQIGKAAVIGAGFIGVELCEAFTAMWGVEVELFEMLEQPLSKMLDREMAMIVEKELLENGVETLFGCRIEGIEKKDDVLNVVTDKGRFSGFDRVIIAAGVKPAVGLAEEAGIELGVTGGIKVDERMRTSREEIYTAGDCVEATHVLTGKPMHIPLGSLANRMGRVAGNVIAGREDVFGAAAGSACVKVFDMNVAAVGLTFKSAKDAGIDAGEVWGVFTDKVHYYPDSELFSAKMVYDRKSQALLGVQVVGKGDVIRRVDAASIMITAGMTLSRVMSFEPAYAPPYANALDPLHFLAYAGIASLEEGVAGINPLELDKIAGESIVIDVREDIEVEEMPCDCEAKDIIHIPLTQFRNRLKEIPQNEKIVVVCQRGTRSSEALRVLKQNGWEEVKYLGGGLGFWLE